MQDSTHFNVVRLTAKAIPVLRGEEKVALAVQRIQLAKEPTKKKKGRGSTTEQTNNPQFETLRALRRKLADEENKPPFMIFSDMTLHEMVRLQPKNVEQLLAVSGVGQHKLAHYGHYFLDALKEPSQ